MRRAILEQLTSRRRPLVRALDPKTGEERLIDPAADTSPLGLAAAAALARDASALAQVEGRDWFLTVYNAPWELVLIGAVHIAQSLSALAPPAGYALRIIDPRPAYASEERFPGVRLVREWPDEALAAEPLGSRSALIALAHDPKIDDPALVAALRSAASYIGALGSARTHARRLARLSLLGLSPSELARIKGPVGIAIGARTPAEIALAILAEITQNRRAPKTGPKIGAVVLAAGLSRRMGANKLMADIDGKPMVRHAVEAALAGGLDPVVVVTGHQPESVAKALVGLDIVLVHNGDYAGGLSTSLRRGIRAVPPDRAGAMVLLGDMPAITPALIRRAVAAFDSKSRAICVATARGRRGHPVLWGRQFFPEISALEGDTGARGLMERHAAQICEIEAESDAPLTDIDTPEDLAAFSASGAAK